MAGVMFDRLYIKMFMKQLLIAAVFTTSFMLLQGCDSDSRYVDPNTGEALNLKEDTESGLMVDAETGENVGIYVDTRTNDTINGRTGKVINGSIRKNNDGTYVYILEDENDNAAKSGDAKVQYEDGEYKIKDGDYKKEVEKDGDVTIKDGDTKIKVDGETGERKVKKDN